MYSKQLFVFTLNNQLPITYIITMEQILDLLNIKCNEKTAKVSLSFVEGSRYRVELFGVDITDMLEINEGSTVIELPVDRCCAYTDTLPSTEMEFYHNCESLSELTIPKLLAGEDISEKRLKIPSTNTKQCLDLLIERGCEDITAIEIGSSKHTLADFRLTNLEAIFFNNTKVKEPRDLLVGTDLSKVERLTFIGGFLGYESDYSFPNLECIELRNFIPSEDNIMYLNTFSCDKIIIHSLSYDDNHGKVIGIQNIISDIYKPEELSKVIEAIFFRIEFKEKLKCKYLYMEQGVNTHFLLNVSNQLEYLHVVSPLDCGLLERFDKLVNLNCGTLNNPVTIPNLKRLSCTNIKAIGQKVDVIFPGNSLEYVNDCTVTRKNKLELSGPYYISQYGRVSFDCNKVIHDITKCKSITMEKGVDELIMSFDVAMCKFDGLRITRLSSGKSATNVAETDIDQELSRG